MFNWLSSSFLAFCSGFFLGLFYGLFGFYLSHDVFAGADYVAAAVLYGEEAVALAGCEVAFVSEALIVFGESHAFFETVDKGTAIFVAVGLADDTFAVHLVVFPVTLVDIAVAPCVFAFAVAEVVFPVTFVGGAVFPRGFQPARYQ